MSLKIQNVSNFAGPSFRVRTQEAEFVSVHFPAQFRFFVAASGGVYFVAGAALHAFLVVFLQNITRNKLHCNYQSVFRKKPIYGKFSDDVVDQR